MKPVHLTLSQLELLQALVESGSFSEAAKRLGITQSTASHALARLEGELGALLVERGRRGVVLTAQGQKVLLHAREVLSHVEAIRGVADEGGVTGGRLRVGMISPLPAQMVAGVVGEFRRTHPDVDLMVGNLSCKELTAWLSEGNLDVALLAAGCEADAQKAPSAKAKKSASKTGGPAAEGVLAVERRPLRRSKMCALLKTDHALSNAAVKGEPAVQVEDLVRESLLLPHAGGEWLAGLFRGDEGRAGARHFLSDAVTMLAAAREGWGIALLPRCVFDGLDLSELTVKSIAPALEWELHLAARSWSHASRVTHAFAEITQAWVARSQR